MSDGGETSVAQAGAIPFQVLGDVLELLVITSRSDPEWWGMPKGNIEPGATPRETVAEECWEEAGIAGTVHEPSAGTYRYEQGGRTVEVEVFPLEVDTEAAMFPEVGERRTEWLPPEAAVERLSSPELRALVADALPRIRALAGGG